jgi:CDP-4-dehydro-6-deoxyglucose reductase
MALRLIRARVSRIADLTHDVREIDLDLADPTTLAFRAGQFVSFQLRPPGGRFPVTRPYSIASPPGDGRRLTLLFNRVPGGPGSGFLFGLARGDEVTCTGPAGLFVLQDDPTRDVLFVATGTGIAPIRSMLLDLLDRDDPRAATLFWGVRSERDLYYQDQLAALAAAHPRFAYAMTLSRPAGAWPGTRGRVTQLVESGVASVHRLAAYVCGNARMIADVTAVLRAKGLCPIFREKYYDDATAEPDD